MARIRLNSPLIPPTGFSLSEDVDATPSFIFTAYDLDLRLLDSSYEGLKSPKKVGKIDLEDPLYLSRSKTNFWRLQNTSRCQNVVPVGTMFWQHLVFRNLEFVVVSEG